MTGVRTGHPTGTTIAFNSDRDGGALTGYLVAPDGSNLRRIDIDAWLEYPAWSPDGTKLAFEGALGANYEVFVVELASGGVTQLTDSPGTTAGPRGRPMARRSRSFPCGTTAASPREPRSAGGRRRRRASRHLDDRRGWLEPPAGHPETGHFVAWSPDGAYLLISGRELYVVRPDGTGRLEIRTPDMPLALGGIPDWR